MYNEYDACLAQAQQALSDNNLPACINICEPLMSQYPNKGNAFFYAATAYTLAGNSGTAIALFERAVALDEKLYGAWNNLGNLLKTDFHMARAKAAFEQAYSHLPPIDDFEGDMQEAIKRCYAETLSNLSTCYVNMHSPRECVVIAKQALEYQEDNAPAHNHLGLAYLELGKFREGWKHYRYRSLCPEFKNVREWGDITEWDGKKVNVLALAGEQGLGDEILFLSCLKDAQKQAKHIVLEVNHKIAGLVRESFPDVEVYTDHNQVMNICKPDAYLSVADLGWLFRNSKLDFPKHKGYLKANPHKVKYWKAKLDAMDSNIKIGLTWAGGTKRTSNVYRTPEIEHFKDLVNFGKENNITFINLQYGEYREELGLPVITDCTEFTEDAALIMALDHVITVNQTVVHLAGALGKDTTCLTPWRCAWRYGLTGEDFIWYPSVKQLRSEIDCNWKPVFERLKDVIRKLQTAK